MITRVGLAVALMAGLALAGVGTPAAASGAVEYSGDGEQWSAEPPAFLADIPVLVPGDQHGDAIWVRNVTGDPLNIALLSEVSDVDPELAEALTLRVNSDGTVVDLPPDEGCHAVPGPQLPPGGTARFHYQVRLDPAAENPVQRTSLDLAVNLVVRGEAGGPIEDCPSPSPSEPAPTEPDPTEPDPTQPEPTAPDPSTQPSEPAPTAPQPGDPSTPGSPGPGVPPPDDGRLPGTGSDVPGWLVLAGAGLAGAGVLLRRAGRGT